MGRPLHECGSLLGTRRYGVKTDGRDDAGVGESRGGGNDGISDVMVNGLWRSPRGERWWK